MEDLVSKKTPARQLKRRENGETGDGMRRRFLWGQNHKVNTVYRDTSPGQYRDIILEIV